MTSPKLADEHYHVIRDQVVELIDAGCPVIHPEVVLYHLQLVGDMPVSAVDVLSSMIGLANEPHPVIRMHFSIQCPECDNVNPTELRLPFGQIGKRFVCESCGHEWNVGERDFVTAFVADDRFKRSREFASAKKKTT